MPLERLVCESCGGQLDADRQICPFCGTRVRVGGAEFVAGGTRACHKCSAANPSADRFCRNCGALITRMCPSCKAINSMDRTRCLGCGGDLHATDALLTTEEIRALLISGNFSDAEAAAFQFIEAYGYTEEALILASSSNLAWGNSLANMPEFRNMSGKRLRRAQYYIDKYRQLYPDGESFALIKNLEREIAAIRTRLALHAKKEINRYGSPNTEILAAGLVYFFVLVLVIVVVAALFGGN